MQRIYKLSWMLLKCSSLAVVAVFIFLALFTQAAYDDYFHYSLYRDGGVIGMVKWFYFNYSGRLTGIGTPGVMFKLFGFPEGYGASMFVLVGAIFAANCFMIRGITRSMISFTQSLWAATIFTAIYFSGIENPSDGLYWMAGFTCFHLGTIGFAFLIGVVAYGSDLSSNKTLVWFVPAVLLVSPFAIAAGEASMILTVAVLFLGAATAWFAKLPSWRTWLVALGLCMPILLVVLLAPGYHVRIGREASPHTLMHSVFSSAYQCVKYMTAWVVDARTLAAGVLVIPTVFAWSGKSTNLHFLKSPKVLLLPLIWLVLIAGIFLIVPMGLRYSAPDRLISITYYYFLLGWIGSVFVVVGHCHAKGIVSAKPPSVVLLAAQAVLMLAIVFKGGMGAGIELLFRAREYHSGVAQWQGLAQKAGRDKAGELALSPLEVSELRIAAFELSTDPEAPQNKSFALFYGLEKVYVKPLGKQESRR